MTAEQFEAGRLSLGWTIAETARELRIDVRTVRRYIKAESIVSGPVARLMEIALNHKAFTETA